MKIKTRDFGEMEVMQEDIVTFKMPIFGFENYSKFVFLSEPEISDHFVWLQSVEEAELCFILVSPDTVLPDYCPAVPGLVRENLGKGDYACWLMCVIAEEFKNSTVNLKSPVFVNPANNMAAQVILEEDLPIRFPLVRKEGDPALC